MVLLSRRVSRRMMIVALPAGLFACTSVARSTGPTDSPRAACPVTLPNENTPPGERPSPSHYGNGKLWTALRVDGVVRFKPGGPGHIEPDGSLTMKWPWWRSVHGKLEIEGRRLDGPAPPLQADIPEGYGDIGFQATALIFPTEGCWEVTGKAGDASLTFVTLVLKES